jgi:hypothetical protein
MPFDLPVAWNFLGRISVVPHTVNIIPCAPSLALLERSRRLTRLPSERKVGRSRPQQTWVDNSEVGLAKRGNVGGVDIFSFRHRIGQHEMPPGPVERTEKGTRQESTLYLAAALYLQSDRSYWTNHR